MARPEDSGRSRAGVFGGRESLVDYCAPGGDVLGCDRPWGRQGRCAGRDKRRRGGDQMAAWSTLGLIPAAPGSRKRLNEDE
jgi:hypothetical protein